MRRPGRLAIEYEHHDFDVVWFVIEQPPDLPNTVYFSLGAGVQGLMPRPACDLPQAFTCKVEGLFCQCRQHPPRYFGASGRFDIVIKRV